MTNFMRPEETKKRMNERSVMVGCWNTITKYPQVVERSLDVFGLTMKDAFKNGSFSVDLPNDVATRDKYTFQNDMSYYMSNVCSSRRYLREIKKQGLKQRHMELAKNRAEYIWDHNYEKKSVSVQAITASRLKERLAMEQDQGLGEYEKKFYDTKQMHVALNFCQEMDRMGLDDWITVKGKQMMYVRTLERKNPLWAEEKGITVQRVVAAHLVKTRASRYSSYKEHIRHHFNIWLMTHKSYDGTVITAANHSFSRARSLMDQYLKNGVLDQLDGL